MRRALSLPASHEAHVRPQAANDSFDEVMVGGLATACLTRAELARVMLHDCMDARGTGAAPKLVFASNGHAIALAAQDPDFRAHFEQADIIHADGQAAVFASRMTSSPIPERSATTDFIHDAARLGAEHGLRFFLLGATEEANAEAARILEETYPGLKIVGRRPAGICLRRPQPVAPEGRLAGDLWRLLQFHYRRLSPRPPMDAGRWPGMAFPPDPRAQKAVLALCRDQPASDLFTFDAHKFA
jgi:hypothetical protein